MSEALAEAPVRERFEVDNDMKAEWCLNKIRKIRDEQHREKDELQRQMQFYADQMEMIDKAADDDVRFFESMLQGYFKSRVDEGFAKSLKSKVSYKLPTGELILKHREPKYDTKDDTFLNWLEKNKLDQYIKIKKEVAWGDFKKTLPKGDDGYVRTIETDDGVQVVTADGEIVPGVKVTKLEDEFVVEVKR